MMDLLKKKNCMKKKRKKKKNIMFTPHQGQRTCPFGEE
jgi:hypothetical protein